jgi:D-alanine--poly(phosphoribitol) ligase subunit 2
METTAHAAMRPAEARQKILQLIVSVTETEEVRSNPDLSLYDTHALDSMQTVELMVAFEREFGVHVSPSEFDRQSWATPRKIVADIERRLHEWARRFLNSAICLPGFLSESNRTDRSLGQGRAASDCTR